MQYDTNNTAVEDTAYCNSTWKIKEQKTIKESAS